MEIYFVSGHLDVTKEEFRDHYIPKLDEAILSGSIFVVGEARGADRMAQDYLKSRNADVTVFHMFEKPRYNAGFPTKGGYKSDEERDAAMTNNSTRDIAWVRSGKENSGTAANIKRRSAKGTK